MTRILGNIHFDISLPTFESDGFTPIYINASRNEVRLESSLYDLTKSDFTITVVFHHDVPFDYEKLLQKYTKEGFKGKGPFVLAYRNASGLITGEWF